MAQPDHAAPTTAFTALLCFSGLNILRSGASLVLLPLYLRYVPPSDYGILAAVAVAAGFFALVATLKLDAAMRTFYFDYRTDSEALAEYIRQAFSASIGFACLLYVVMLFVGDGVFRLLFAHEELRFFPVGALAFATSGAAACLSCYFVYLRNSLRLHELVAWQTALTAGTLAFQVLLMTVFELGLYGVLWGALLPTGLALLVLCIVRPGLLGVRFSRRVLAPSLSYGAPLLALGICYALATRLDRLVLERYVTLETLGTYAVLASLLGLLALVLDALDNAIRPNLHAAMTSSAVGHKPPMDVYQGAYLSVGFLALSAAVFLGSQLHLVTSSLAYLNSREWLVLGATTFAPTVLTRYYALFFELHKRSIDLGLASVIRLLVLGLLLFWWVPTLGIRGALLSLLVAETLNAGVVGWIASREFAVRTSLRSTGTRFGIFLGAIWLLASAVADESMAAFGTLQLAVISGALLVANRGALLALWRAVRPSSQRSYRSSGAK